MLLIKENRRQHATHAIQAKCDYILDLWWRSECSSHASHPFIHKWNLAFSVIPVPLTTPTPNSSNGPLSAQQRSTTVSSAISQSCMAPIRLWAPWPLVSSPMLGLQCLWLAGLLHPLSHPRSPLRAKHKPWKSTLLNHPLLALSLSLLPLSLVILHSSLCMLLSTRFSVRHRHFICVEVTHGLSLDAATIRKNMEAGIQSVKDKAEQVLGSHGSDVKSGSATASASHKVAAKVADPAGKPDQFAISSSSAPSDKKHYNEWVANILVEVCVGVISVFSYLLCSRNTPPRLVSSSTSSLCVSATYCRINIDLDVGRL